MQPGRYVGSILLADISGYSSFLNSAAKVDPPFTFLKFEGDAAFAVAPDGAFPVGPGMIDCVFGCYADFSARKAAAGEVWTCTCDACSREGSLDLKFIVHHGEFFVQQVGGRVDAVGPEINVAHRLLKNDAASVVESSGYALFTDETVTALGLELHDAARLEETVDDGHRVQARVIPLPA